MRSAVDEAHQHLVDQLIARGALWSPALIGALRSTPRHCFVERIYEFHKDADQWQEIVVENPGLQVLALIYSDRVLTTRLSEDNGPLTGKAISSSSQPSLMTQMLEDLQLYRGQRILEIGSGTGFNAALMARISGDVTSIDVDRRVLNEAAQHLEGFSDRRVAFHHGDGRAGWLANAPYDRIMVTAASPDLEPAWLEQCADGARIVAPVSLASGLAYVVTGIVHGGTFRGRLNQPAFFMPLRDEAEVPVDNDSTEHLPPCEHLTTVAAPWADWIAQRSASDQESWRHALAFLGFLCGHVVQYSTLPDKRSGYGLADHGLERVCWMGLRQWWVNGTAGRDLGMRLWRHFLDCGGPRPGDFVMQAHPEQFPLAPESSLVTFHRTGPRCLQTWYLPCERLPRCLNGE
jgi:protein-L-isoaspartate(D-aspartate) O-methyltransferase